MADDLGWANVGFHRTADSDPNNEVQTPIIDELAKNGIILDRYYVFKICSPSRSSFQTGRLPVHVNDMNYEPELHNALDPISGYAGIPIAMTGIAEKLRSAGYRTAMTGKWDAGMATPSHTPIGRGYETWLGYFHHANDYYTEGLWIESTGAINVCQNRFTDLWDTHLPARNLTGKGTYEEEIFTNRTIDILLKHDTKDPLFLVHAFHLIHTPLQVPESYLDQFDFIPYSFRKHYQAMAKYMDDVVGKIVSVLKDRSMWESTLLVFSTDNGGAIYYGAGGNNWPLKGGKLSDWEGGVRGVAFVSGGVIPTKKQGTSLSSLFHVSDWYTTFCAIAGVKKTDHKAHVVGLPEVDGIDQSSILLNEHHHESKRHEIHLSSQALIDGDYKLIVGSQPMSGWTSPQYPNATGQQPSIIPRGWEHNCSDGELYNIINDPSEYINLASIMPTRLKDMQNRLSNLNANNFKPFRGKPDIRACKQAELYGGFYGPWLETPMLKNN